MIQRFSILFLSLLLLGAATGVVAQVHVKGTVVRSGEPAEAVEMAAVRLLNIKDSAMVKGTVTDREGRFDLMGVRQGDYLLHVTYVGLDPLYQRLHISGSKTPVDVGRLTMTEDGVLLGEAVMTARAVEVQVKNDTVEYSASAYKVAEGSVLEDLLKKIVRNIRVFWKCLLIEFQQALRALRNLGHFRVIPDIPIPCEHPLPIVTPISFEISMLAHQLSQFRNSASNSSIE